MDNVFIAGCGRLGRRIACLEQKLKRHVFGLCRSESSKDELTSLGIMPVCLDLDASTVELALEFDSLYYLLPPPSQGDYDLRIQTFLSAIDRQSHLIKRMLLLSTTGVYGDCQGKWVDESYPAQAMVARAKRRLHAESVFMDWAKPRNINAVILRVPGIYSAQRLPLTRLQKQIPILDPKLSGFSNRIHEHDLAEIAVRAMHAGFQAEVFNVADDQPSSMSDYFLQIAKVFSLPQPDLLTRSQAAEFFSAEMNSYLNESRRISNRKLKRLLNYNLMYPTLKQGLEQCLAELSKNKID